MRCSDLLLAENVMDIRCDELRHSARAHQQGGVPAHSRLLVSAGSLLVAVGSWLRQVGLNCPLDPATSFQGRTVEPRPAGR